MPCYEHVFLTRQDASNAQVDQLTEQFKSVIAGLGGKTGKTEYWGVKSLTFRIKKNRKAHYTYLDIEAPPAAVAEMERQMSINEDVIRFITVRVQKHEDGPSAMMKAGSRRDERGGGRGFGGRGGRGFDDLDFSLDREAN
jgi:small subunit ribosomal protein S6